MFCCVLFFSGSDDNRGEKEDNQTKFGAGGLGGGYSSLFNPVRLAFLLHLVRFFS